MEKVNVLFMGTTEFAKEVLATLLTMAEVKVVGAVCQPDRKIGRKQEITLSPVKQLAQAKELPLFQPEKISTEYDNLAKLGIDVIVTCAYGQFLPSKVLSLAKILPLNIHASLLPKLRGGAPIQWAIINNFKETGVTLMKMSPKMDAGDIFTQDKVTIAEDETYLSLTKKLIALTKEMLSRDLLKIVQGEIPPQQQNESEVTFGLNITRTDEKINWDQSATLVSCHTRGLYDQPIAYTTMNNFIYKIHQVAASPQKSTKLPGTITLINNLGIFVATKDFDVVIKQIQPAGKKAISASSYFGSKENPLKVDLVFQ